MTSNTKDFYGKEVTDAIKKACDKLQVPQEQLEIEVVETGSTGIFGLIRKKAHIRAHVKKSEGKTKKPGKVSSKQQTAPTTAEKDNGEAPSAPSSEAAPVVEAEKMAPPPKPRQSRAEKTVEEEGQTDQEAHAAVQQHENHETRQVQNGDEEQGYLENGDEDDDKEFSRSSTPENDQAGTEASETTLALIKEELNRILELMGYPSGVEISASGTSVLCKVSEEHEAVLTGQDGKTLDALQYLLRKIVARKVPERLRLSVDVGSYREKRLDELKAQALDLACKVKEDGKTQVIAALSPSERRVIHMSLQEDKEIRSRSVGDGLFKKILIYKPGKGGGKGGGRKRGNSRGRKGGNNRKKNDGTS